MTAIKRAARWAGLLLGVCPAWVVREAPAHRGFFVVRARWWASREDLYAAVAKAQADGVIPRGPVGYGGQDADFWEG